MTPFVERHAGALQLAFVIGVIAFALLVSLSLRPDAAGPRSEAPVTEQVVSIVTPASAPYQPSVRLNGVIEARTVTSVIPQVSGRVINVSPLFRPGGRVSKGAILFQIDPADFRLAIDRTLAEIEVARSDLARLEAEAAAEREIWKGQFPDRKIPDLIARVPQIAAAKARIKSGEAARQTAELALRRTTVRAHFDARVLETQLDVGQVVGSNSPVGTIFSVDSLEIAVPVSAEDRKLIGPLNGQAVWIYLPDSAAGPVQGRPVRESAALDERTRLGTLYISAEPSQELTVGEFVEIQIDGVTASAAYRLPAAALTSRDQVWVVDDGRLAERTVDVIGRDADLIVVRVFDEADGVVIVPPPNAANGLPVSARTAAETATMQRDSN